MTDQCIGCGMESDNPGDFERCRFPRRKFLAVCHECVSKLLTFDGIVTMRREKEAELKKVDSEDMKLLRQIRELEEKRKELNSRMWFLKDGITVLSDAEQDIREERGDNVD